jgi:predicted  nucleic acid-binding Zn-ribbon protein
MAELDNIVLEYLRHIRAATDDIRNDVREVVQSIESLENHYVRMSNRLDRMGLRIERIERRLDLTNA